MDQLGGRPLTSRQEQVLDLVVQGASNKAIARRLRISEQVAKEHVSALLRRFNSPNRTALAHVGISVRLLGATAGRFVSLSYLFRDAPMGIGIVAGPDHVYVAVNDAYRTIIGGREVVGVSVADAFSDAPPDRFIALLDEVRAGGTARFEPDYEGRWDRRGHGPEAGYASLWLQPMRDESGAVTGAVIYVTDTTDIAAPRSSGAAARVRSRGANRRGPGSRKRPKTTI
jgi:DNA-binding CsgD family transcriptional regulator